MDAAALRRIFDNILSNAVKYADGDLTVSLLPNGTVTFSNSAPSLSRVQAERLFDRFYTVEAARNATGLGLSIAKLLAEKMGGTIAAQYESGRLHISIAFPLPRKQCNTFCNDKMWASRISFLNAHIFCICASFFSFFARLSQTVEISTPTRSSSASSWIL